VKYYLGGQIRMRWVGHAACMGKGETYKGFWYGNLKGNTRLKRYMRKWGDNIKTDHRGTE
jgi:hypothetical protein